jgi:hypothetical protein
MLRREEYGNDSAIVDCDSHPVARHVTFADDVMTEGRVGGTEGHVTLSERIGEAAYSAVASSAATTAATTADCSTSSMVWKF